MNTKVRYTLDKTAVLHTDNGKVYLDNPENCFVDLLEPMECEGICKPVKIKVFCPDGNILVGSVVGFNIRLTNKDALYDGRFNSTQE